MNKRRGLLRRPNRVFHRVALVFFSAAMISMMIWGTSGCEQYSVTDRQDFLEAGDTLTLKVMSTTDVHGRVRAWDYYLDREQPEYALSKIATLVDSIREQHPHTMLLDAGDWLQGNSFAEYFALHDPEKRHYPFLAVVDFMEYDAVVLGNHEFNFGLDYLNRQLELTQTPVIGANIYHHQTKDPAYSPYVIRDVAGIRVAVIGLTTPGSAVWDRARVEGILDFGDGMEAAENFAAYVRDEENADIVVILAHSGLDGESSYQQVGVGQENFGRDVGENVAGIDLLVLGHTHRSVSDVYLEGADGRTVGVVQPGRWASHLGVASLQITRDPDGNAVVTSQKTYNIPVKEADEHPEVLAMTEETHRDVVDFVTEPLVYTEEEWTAGEARLQDTPIIDLIQHVQKKVTGADLSVAAAFNTSAAFGPGPVTRGDIAMLYPYFNTLYKLEVTGAQIRQFLEHTSQYYLTGTDDSGMPIVNRRWPGFNFDMLSGMEYVLDVRRPIGERVTRLHYKGAPVDEEDRFTMAVNSYRAEGGGGFDMLADAPVLERIDRSVGDMIIEFLQEHDTLRQEEVFAENWHLVY